MSEIERGHRVQPAPDGSDAAQKAENVAVDTRERQRQGLPPGSGRGRTGTPGDAGYGGYGG